MTVVFVPPVQDVKILGKDRCIERFLISTCQSRMQWWCKRFFTWISVKLIGTVFSTCSWLQTHWLLHSRVPLPWLSGGSWHLFWGVGECTARTTCVSFGSTGRRSDLKPVREQVSSSYLPVGIFLLVLLCLFIGTLSLGVEQLKKLYFFELLQSWKILLFIPLVQEILTSATREISAGNRKSFSPWDWKARSGCFAKECRSEESCSWSTTFDISKTIQCLTSA